MANTFTPTVSDWPKQRTLVIGIAGGSGSGKSTIAETVAAPDPQVQVIRQDSYYRHEPELDYEQRAGQNYDHPDAFESDLLIEQLSTLRDGGEIRMPQYDFTSHLRAAETVPLSPSAVLIVEGILVLADPALRQLMDLKIYVDTDADLRLIRRLRRDINERGRTINSVLEQYESTVRPMQIEFVEPSKRHADVIIPGGFNPRAGALVRQLIRSRLEA